MRILCAALLSAALGGLGLVIDLHAQGPGGPPATYKSAAEIEATLKKMGAVAKTGAAATVAEGVVVRRRSASDEAQYAIIHPLSIEIYQITDGSATLVTGGTLKLPLSDRSEERRVGKEGRSTSAP